MSCTLAMVMVAGIYLNPCEIQELKPRLEKFSDRTVEECVVKYRSGDAWSGQYASRVKAPCTTVVEEISKQTLTERQTNEEIID